MKTSRIGRLVVWGVLVAAVGIAQSTMAAEPSGRKPQNDEELRYWLANTATHRFDGNEIAAALGLTDREVGQGFLKFNIDSVKPPPLGKPGALLMLPYPGGRHPRIGFLDGAIDPQRETKLSVFLPWDQSSYVVVDLPEAIWSNLGLTYLAHTHIDTVWTKQGVKLPPLEWQRNKDGSLELTRKLPNGIVYAAKAEPTKEAILMELSLTNGTKEKLTGLKIQNCVMLKAAKGFAEQTNDNKRFATPFVACRNAAGDKWIITAWERCQRAWGNAPCPCLHSDPQFADLDPGASGKLKGWLWFYEGKDVEAEMKRLQERYGVSG